MSTEGPSLRSLLAVATDREAFAGVEPMLARSVIGVYRCATAAEAFEPLDTRRFELILVGHPLPDVKLQDFLLFLRRPGAGNRGTRVVVLTTGEPPPSAEAVLDNVAVVSFARPRVEALTEISGFLGVARRLHHRMLVRLEVRIDDRAESRAFQTADISETGMLIRTEHLYPVTTRLALRFDLPTDGSRIETEAIVVRHAEADKEGVTGMGLRFVGLKESDRDRLRELFQESPRRGSGA